VIDEVEEVGEFGFRAVARFVAMDGRDDVGGSGGDVFVDRYGGIEFELLGEVSGAEVAAGSDLAGVGLIFAGENFEERGFAAAVAADESDFLTRFDGEGDAVE